MATPDSSSRKAQKAGRRGAGCPLRRHLAEAKTILNHKPHSIRTPAGRRDDAGSATPSRDSCDPKAASNSLRPCTSARCFAAARPLLPQAPRTRHPCAESAHRNRGTAGTAATCPRFDARRGARRAASAELQQPLAQQQQAQPAHEPLRREGDGCGRCRPRAPGDGTPLRCRAGRHGQGGPAAGPRRSGRIEARCERPASSCCKFRDKRLAGRRPLAGCAARIDAASFADGCEFAEWHDRRHLGGATWSRGHCGNSSGPRS